MKDSLFEDLNQIATPHSKPTYNKHNPQEKSK
jgi:hypothetical protein